MPNIRIVRNCILLALPVVALLGFGAYFLCVSVPRIMEREQQWATAESHRVAEILRKGKFTPSFVWEYDKGVVEGGEKWAALYPAKMTWKDWQADGPKRSAKKMWGWKFVDGKRMVWARNDKKVLGLATEIAETNYALMSWIFAPLLFASIAALAGFAIYSLVSYAKSREDFLAATAHDLTTPLVGMRLMIGRDDAEAQNLNERLIRIVRNICEFMRLGGRRRYAIDEFDLRKAYDEAYRLFDADYRDLFDGDDVAVTASPGEEYIVCADEIATIQIIWNILGNDLKYAAPHGRVAVRFSRSDGLVNLEFLDEGPGMNATGRRHAFDRFWRAKTVLESGKGGFGIGLCVAREAARAMHGDLTLSRNTPHGCIFTLSLPGK